MNIIAEFDRLHSGGVDVVGKKKDEDAIRKALSDEADRTDNADSSNYTDDEALAEILRRANGGK